MKKESIITLPNPNLREKSARVHVITDDVLQLIDNMTSASLDWEDSRPHEISAALARLDDGTYGVCETCGQPIPLDRLRARPTARRCIACA